MHRMVKRSVEMEGTVTGEHGVGLIKRDYLEHEVGETTVDAMRKVSTLCSRSPVGMTFSIDANPFTPFLLAQTSIRSTLLAQLQQSCAGGFASSGRDEGVVIFAKCLHFFIKIDPPLEVGNPKIRRCGTVLLRPKHIVHLSVTSKDGKLRR